tara:strand:- start:1111 stop:1590 length:480 start_codon:yes stop_codon:yes gene_type:complete
MRIDIEWEDVPVTLRIINTPPKFEYVDAINISGFNYVRTRSRYSSFSYASDVVDVKGVFDIETRNGIGGMQSKVDEIVIPALEMDLTLTEKNDGEFTDTEEQIKTQEKILKRDDFEGLENYSNAPDLNVTEIRIAIDYETKKVSLDRKYGGIAWGQYYE